VAFIKRETNDRVSPDFFKFKENMENCLSYIINPSWIPPNRKVN
jgi:hypothetical protein